MGELPNRILLVSLLVILSVGCAYSKINKGDFEASSFRILWNTEGFNASYDPINGTYNVNLGTTGQDIEGVIKLLKAVK